MIKIISKRKIYFSISTIFLVLSIVALATWGLKLGIDFTGGSLLEVTFQNTARPTNEEINNVLSPLDYLGNVTIQPSGEDGIILRFNEINEEEHQAVLTRLRENFSADQDAMDIASADNTATVQIESDGGVALQGIKADTISNSQEGAVAAVIEERFDSIGPSIGAELKTKSFYAIIIVILAIVAYIAWAFRKVGRPVASWKYGVIAVVALVHDVLITCGVFAVLGHYFGVELNTPFVAAILTILGYSVNDTIVVFDRIRENLHRYQGDFEETINISVNETLARSVNTALTTLLVLIAVYLFGGETIKDFVLALIIGIISGTYSSIFIASPLLVTWQNFSRKSGK